jgi:hemerythrin superfamily protein
MATASDPAAKPDVLALLVRDHKEVDELFEQFDDATETSATTLTGGLVSQLIEALSVHAAVEEQIVYPAMREALPDGETKVRDAIADHQKVKDTLAVLEQLAPIDDEVLSTVKALAKDVRAHVAEEESELFPRLAEALDEQKLQDMGRAIEKARKTAPTRPHSGASDKPPANVVGGAFDRVRDVLDEAAEKGRELFESRGRKRP